MMTCKAGANRRSQIGLDWVNFFVADLQTSFGPFVAVHLSVNGWAQGPIGWVMTINNLVALATAVPAGALVDGTRRKRTVVAAGIVLTGLGAFLIAVFPTYWPVFLAQVMHGLTGGAIQTALIAIGLGLVGQRAFHTRVGRNQGFGAFGNCLTAAAMGVAGTLMSPRAPFFVTMALCVPALYCLRMIHASDIDYARARLSEGRKEPRAAGWRELLKNRRLLVLAACMFLFQFADASMLPLASERLVAEESAFSVAVTAALVIVPQLITALLAGLIARKADEMGRKRLLVIGFAMLPVRAVLFALTSKAWMLVGVQALAGFTAPVIGILVPLVVADVVRRSGRYNVALSTTTMIGVIGAAVSTTVSGYVAQHLGFFTAYAVLAVAGLLGLGLLAALLPETSDEAKRED
jgi:MFS family permease